MYQYEMEKPALFTEHGSRTFLSIRDRTHRLLKEAGAVRMQEAMGGHSGDSWFLLACVDRLVELGEIREITKNGVIGQHRVFVSTAC